MNRPKLRTLRNARNPPNQRGAVPTWAGSFGSGVEQTPTCTVHLMAEYTIERDGADLTIRLSDVGADGTRLLAAFEDCQHGQCDCPTDEYEKVSALSVNAEAAHVITLHLVPKPGMRFDEAEIDACLLHTVTAATE